MPTPSRTGKPALINPALRGSETDSGQLFYSTQLFICLWFPAKNKAAGKHCTVSELELALAA